jgi:hypothetical protein
VDALRLSTLRLTLAATLVAAGTAAAAPRFEDAAEQAGAVFSHARAEFDASAKPIMPWLTAGGAGVAVGDFDRDGLDDMYVLTSRAGKPNALFRNKGNFQFEDVAAEVGLADVNRAETGTSGHAIWLDYDGDGWLDLLLLRFGQLALFRNLEGQRFEEVTAQAGLTRLLNALAAVAFDYDRDGDLDLYIGGYFPEKDFNDLPDTKVLFDSWETARNGGPNYLYRNDGDGTFTDVTEQAGVQDTGWSMAVGHGDLDNDGWQDLYVANDFGTDSVFRNNGDGTFANVSESVIGIDTKKGMNAEIGDYNNDGLLDIYVTNMTEPYLHECTCSGRTRAGSSSWTWPPRPAPATPAGAGGRSSSTPTTTACRTSTPPTASSPTASRTTCIACWTSSSKRASTCATRRNGRTWPAIRWPATSATSSCTSASVPLPGPAPRPGSTTTAMPAAWPSPTSTATGAWTWP